MNGDFPPNLLFKARQFRIKMVFLIAQLFRKMPYRRAAKRPRYGKRDKYSIQQKAAVAAVAANQTSGVDIVPATITEGMRKVKHLTVNLTQTATGSSGGAEQPLSARVCPSRDNCRGTQHRNSRRNSKQHVRNPTSLS